MDQGSESNVKSPSKVPPHVFENREGFGRGLIPVAVLVVVIVAGELGRRRHRDCTMSRRTWRRRWSVALVDERAAHGGSPLTTLTLKQHLDAIRLAIEFDGFRKSVSPSAGGGSRWAAEVGLCPAKLSRPPARLYHFNGALESIA